MFNQKFKLYNNYTKDAGDKSTFMLKVSGIWEDDYNIGLTYKIVQVSRMCGI